MEFARKPVALIILDGLGVSTDNEEKKSNATTLAKTPYMDELFSDYPWIKLNAHGLSVGLPKGQMGNSEVGHMNIGAGRVVYQELTRIDQDIADGGFQENPVITQVMKTVNNRGKALHVWGLLSEGGVHSHIEHLFALLKLAKEHGLKKVYVHAVTDGRDVPPKIASKDIAQLEDFIQTNGIGEIKTVMGRFYAMDRDERWDRTEKAYKAFKGKAQSTASTATEAVEIAYEREELDEFISPVNIEPEEGSKSLNGYVGPGDGVICFNFRPDRARQMTRYLVENEDIDYVCFTQYDKEFDLPVAYSPQELKNIAGEYLSKQERSQFRIAETEKYAHVTFFFNGGNEKAYPLEDRVLIPSPKVNTYDQKPEMSAYEVTEEARKNIDKKDYDFVLINYANPDMVGHTGDLQACIKAMETIDKCLADLIPYILDKGGIAIVTSDHGNAEMMFDPDSGDAHTAHTNNQVPFILVDREKVYGLKELESSKLADIIPTVFELMNLEKPAEMTGRSLLQKQTKG